MSSHGNLIIRAGVSFALIFGASFFYPETRGAEVEITVREIATKKPVACRLHLKDPAGKPVRAGQLPFWRDHFVFAGRVQLDLPPGKYTYEAERGPEYLMEAGSFTVTDSGSNQVNIGLTRLVEMAAEGWWSGDLHVHRLLKEIELLMQAEDLHVAPVMTWWNNQNQWKTQTPPQNPLVQFDKDRCYQVMAGEDEREGGALLFFNLDHPLAIAGSSREYPSPMKFVEEARQRAGTWIDIEKPFWWDVPVWLASGQMDSIGLANNHMCRDQMYESEAWGMPRDSRRLPSPRGNGFWSQEIYYHALNCGLRIPPSAGSASGVLPNPVGYDRVYVHLGKNFSHAKWWEGLRAGRSFVSNGPLLRCRANGKLPGHIFKARQGKQIKIELQASLSARDPISFIEIIKNGRVERAVPFEEWKRSGRLGTLGFSESGWFLVRTVCDNPKTFRFASTAPYYVEIGEGKRRISKTSVQFFLDWVRERMARVKVDDPSQRQEVLKYHKLAETFWQEKLAQANAE